MAALVVTTAATAWAAGAAFGRDLGAREARDAIAKILGRSRDEVRIKSIAPGLVGDDAVVTAQMDVAFQMTRRDGEWQIASVRLSDGRWENVDLLLRALDVEKERRAEVDLRALAEGLEEYRRARGFYPDAVSVADLVDKITPTFTPQVIRIDPWNRPYYYQLGPDGYRLGSPGPDGLEGTPDDVVVVGRVEAVTR